MAPTRLQAPSYSSLQSGSRWELTSALAPAEGIESAFFTHVIYAARALETAVMSDPYLRAVDGITSALNALQSAVNDQEEQNQTLKRSLSLPKTLPSGLILRDLPIPPVDKIMTCLRITQGAAPFQAMLLSSKNPTAESSPTEIYWPFEFRSLGDFTQYVIRACTPGPISDMELIIVHYVLYSLFTQFSICADDETLKQDYDAQAATCRESLETLLSSLSFHIDTNIDSISALYMAVRFSILAQCITCSINLRFPTYSLFIACTGEKCPQLGRLSQERRLCAWPWGCIAVTPWYRNNKTQCRERCFFSGLCTPWRKLWLYGSAGHRLLETRISLSHDPAWTAK
jgi:hypothetical protein